MTELSHEEAYSELAAVALDAGQVEIADAVRAHASVCPECGPELASMEATMALLGQLVPHSEMSPGRSAGVRSRLIVRAGSERKARAASGRKPDLLHGVASLAGQGHRVSPTSSQAAAPEARMQQPVRPIRQPGNERGPASRTNWLAIAATLLLAAASAQLFRVTADRNAMRDQLAARGGDATRADSLAASLAESNALVAAMTGSDVKVVSLASESARQPQAQMFWNRASDDWTMIASGLPSLKPGRTYQVWLVTDSAKISAGTFEPDARGRTVLRAKYALDRNALRAVAITDEPAGGVPAPTGAMVIVGAATP
ncbi:MAG: anti-sigma factor [Gemmatimonadaceae bacterium]